MLRRLLVYLLVLRYITVNLETFIGFQLVLRYIRVNLKTIIDLSISFKIYNRLS